MYSEVKKMLGKVIQDVKELKGRVIREGVNGVNGTRWVRVGEPMMDSYGKKVSNIEITYLVLLKKVKNGWKVEKITKD